MMMMMMIILVVNSGGSCGRVYFRHGASILMITGA